MQLMKLEDAMKLTGVHLEQIRILAKVGKVKLYGTPAEPLVDVGRLYKIRMKTIIRRTLQDRKMTRMDRGDLPGSRRFEAKAVKK